MHLFEIHNMSFNFFLFSLTIIFRWERSSFSYFTNYSPGCNPLLSQNQETCQIEKKHLNDTKGRSLAFFPLAMVLLSSGIGEGASGQSHVAPSIWQTHPCTWDLPLTSHLMATAAEINHPNGIIAVSPEKNCRFASFSHVCHKVGWIHENTILLFCYKDWFIR